MLKKNYIACVNSKIDAYFKFFFLIDLMYEELKLEFVYVHFVGITKDGTKDMNMPVF